MNGKEYLELTPELLLQQSQEMMVLKEQYVNLFENLLKDLNGMNASWSENLSNNFAGKIASAQKSFAGVAKMLENGSYAAVLSANDLGGMDMNLSKLIGGTGTDVKGLVKKAQDLLAGLGKVTGMTEAFGDAKDVIEKIEKIEENCKGELTSSQEAWLKYIKKKATGLLGSDTKSKVKDFELGLDITEKIIKGDWEGAMEKAGVSGTKELVKKYCEVMGIDTKDYVTGKKVDWYTDYGINLFQNTVEAYTEILYEGDSLENIGRLGWNLTAQPILDTAGNLIYEQVSMIPGISEYYIDEKGCKDIGDMASVALGDWYGMISPDPGMAEYASNYYKDAGGVWEGIYQGGEEWMSFVKDSGGWGEAVKNYAETAWKDTKEAFGHNVENVEILYKEGKEWVENVGDFIDEQGGIGNAAKEFFETAGKDAWDGITKTAGNVWNSIFSKETLDIIKGKK